jgi:hypothetical protein
MNSTQILYLLACTVLATFSAHAASGFSAGAAPKGDAQAVATRIIKYNFPQCKRITNVSRQADGTIRATCDGVSYYIFTMYVPSEGKMHELAIDCGAAKRLLQIDCPR